MEIAASVVTKVVELAVDPVIRQLGYLFCYTRNTKDFEGQVKSLKIRRDDIQSKVKEASDKGESILKGVAEWLEDVEKISEESENFITKEINANRKCVNEMCPNLWHRYYVSRKAKKKTEVLVELYAKGDFQDFAVRVPLAEIASSSNKNQVVFEFRQTTFRKIMDALIDKSACIIGICGMGGVGKTTLLEEICKQAGEKKLFDTLLMVTISQTPNFESIQQKIADMIGLEFTEKTPEAKAERLRWRLCEMLKEKKILFLVDDVWGEIDLEKKVGIPYGENYKGSRIVLTSRSRDVCDQMGCKPTYQVEGLNDDEAWGLFKGIVGEIVESADRKDIATRIVGKCGGLPLLIKAVANTLKKKSLSHWEVCISELKGQNLKSVVREALQFSYDYLSEPDAKEMFLLCCLFPEDEVIDIQDLFRLGLGFGLFQNTTPLDTAMAQADVLVDYLKSSSLLLESQREGFVLMHDVIRKFAISVASKDKHVFLVGTDQEFNFWEKKHDFTRCTAISLQIDIVPEEIPDEWEWPELVLLKLEGNWIRRPLKLPSNIFKRMENLRVLSMTKIEMMSVPASFEYLKSLRTLCFDRCQLKEISIIGELKNLEILSFCLCEIEELPKEIEKLTNLRFLELTDCKNLRLVPSSVICSLSNLEGLYMRSFSKWKVGKDNASVEDLKKLSSLVALEVCIPDDNLWPDDLVFRNLTRFKISVGDTFYHEDEHLFSHSSKLLKLKTNTTFKKGLNMLLKIAGVIYMEGMNALHNLNEYPSPLLKVLVIKKCREVKSVIDTTKSAPLLVFPLLEILEICDMDNLQELYLGMLLRESFGELRKLILKGLPQLMNVWKNPTEHASLQKLRVLEVSCCHKLKSIFSLSMVRDLAQLQEMKVSQCKTLEDIIDGERNGDEDEIVFPQLLTLKLEDLPKLRRFMSSLSALATSANCGSGVLEPFFNNQVAFPKLEDMCFSNIDSVREMWTGKFRPEMTLPQLRSLKLKNLPNLTHVWNMNSNETIHMEIVAGVDDNARRLIELPCLQFITLENLPIFESFQMGRHALFDGKVAFPSLEELELIDVPKLMHVWENIDGPPAHVSLQNLISLHILRCDTLKNVVSCERDKTMVVSEEIEVGGNTVRVIMFPALQKLSVSNVPKLTGFSAGNGTLFDEKVAFPSLEELELIDVPKLMHVWENIDGPPAHVSLQNLISLLIFRCDTLKNVVSCERDKTMAAAEEKKVGGNTIGVITFPALQKLCVINVPNLTGFFAGNGTLFDEKVAFPSLEELTLIDVPKLMHVWKNIDGPPAHVSLQNLISLHILRCDTLKNVVSCERDKTMVVSEEIEVGGNTVGVIMFPTLQKLSVSNVPTLTGFFAGNGTLFDEKVAFPSLEELTLIDVPKLMHVWKNIDGPPAHVSLQNLISLHILRCDTLKNVVSCERDKTMVVSEEIEVGGNTVGVIMFPTLQKLSVSNVPNLTGFFAGNGTLFDEKVAFPSLEELTLIDVPKLMHVWKNIDGPPAHVSLQNLISLHILRCDTLKNVVSCERDKTMAAAEEIKVGGNTVGVIMFPALQELSVRDVPNLTSFFTGNGTLFDEKVAFPALERLDLSKLNNITELWSPAVDQREATLTFHHLNYLRVGGLPKLEYIFDKKVSYPAMRLLWISEMDGLRDIWPTQPSSGSGSFHQLEGIRVERCHKLLTVVPSYLFPKLQSLKVFYTKHCNSVEVITCDDSGQLLPATVTLPHLEYIGLRHNPVLGSFCHHKCDLELPSLRKVWLYGCPNMENFPFENIKAPRFERVVNDITEDDEIIREMGRSLDTRNRLYWHGTVISFW